MELQTPPRYRLAPTAYYDPGDFAREQRLLFGRTWNAVASADDLPNPGDYLAVHVGDDPILLVRGADGELHAHHNLCPHRGMVLLEGSGNTGDVVHCGYHSWRFELDGALRSVPQRGEQFAHLDPARCGLVPASVATFGGLILVHPDAGAPPFADYLGDFGDRLGSFAPELLTQHVEVRMPAACNWKIFVENHIDVLHLWYLHARTLGDFDHWVFEHDQVGPHWVSYEPLKADRRGADGRDTRPPVPGLPPIAHLSGRDRWGIGAHLIFPNIMFATTESYWASYIAEPVAPDRTDIVLRVRSEPDADPALLEAACRSFIDEDIAACEGVQRGVRSSRFAVGPLAAEHERPIELFHTHLIDAMEAP